MGIAGQIVALIGPEVPAVEARRLWDMVTPFQNDAASSSWAKLERGDVAGRLTVLVNSPDLVNQSWDHTWHWDNPSSLKALRPSMWCDVVLVVKASIIPGQEPSLLGGRR